jgi:CyaY protein
MQDELDFRKRVEAALDALKRALYAAEDAGDGAFEVEEHGGVLNIVFEDPPAKFVVTPNAPVRQIWISALSTSYKLDWSNDSGAFVLPKTNERLNLLVARLIGEHTGGEAPAL